MLEMQPGASLVSKDEGQGSKNYVGEAEDRLDYSVVTAEHSGKQNSMPVALRRLQKESQRHQAKVLFLLPRRALFLKIWD